MNPHLRTLLSGAAICLLSALMAAGLIACVVGEWVQFWADRGMAAVDRWEK
jgi:hypothetical protein